MFGPGSAAGTKTNKVSMASVSDTPILAGKADMERVIEVQWRQEQVEQRSGERG